MKEKIDALRTANEYINNLKRGIIDSVELIQNDNEERGIALIPDIAEGIGWVLNVIELTKDAQKKKIEFNDINEKLEEVVEALENDDFILIGDLLKYEILPIIEEIHIGIRKNLEN